MSDCVAKDHLLLDHHVHGSLQEDFFGHYSLFDDQRRQKERCSDGFLEQADEGEESEEYDELHC